MRELQTWSPGEETDRSAAQGPHSAATCVRSVPEDVRILGSHIQGVGGRRGMRDVQIAR